MDLKLLLILMLTGIADGQTYTDIDNLLSDLFNESRYNRLIRPLVDQSEKMEVNITLYLTAMESFDISTGLLHTTGHFEITWFDEFLAWDPLKYGGKEIVQLSMSKIWKPYFAFTNQPDGEDVLTDRSSVTPVWVSCAGYVTMFKGGIFDTRCDVDTTYYPFDTHICIFPLTVLNHDTSELTVASSTFIVMDDFKENIEWEVYSRNVDENKNVSVPKKWKALPLWQRSVIIKRRPGFEMLNNILLVTFLTFLNIFACFVRPDSGERLSFAVTLYLSLVFADAGLIANIPNNSLKIPVIAYDIFVMNLINTAGVFWSIFMVHLSKTSNTNLKMPAFVLRYVSKQIRKRNMTSSLPTIDSSKGNYVEGNDTCGEIIGKTNITDSNGNDVETENVNTEKEELSGLDVALVLDNIYFVVSLTTFIDLYVVILIIYLSN